jgi:hypothetical protein
MTEHRLTASELAVVRAIRQGYSKVDEIQAATGAERWWVEMNVWHLLRRHLIVGDRQGHGLRVV